MKTFLVFLALMIVNVSFLSFHTDMTRYQKLQVYLKAAAEEGAAGGSLYQDGDAYRQGKLVIKKDDAEKYAALIMKKAEVELKKSIAGKVRFTVEIFDDEKGYAGCDQFGLSEGVPAVRLSLEVKCRDLFRLPFLAVTSVKRSAVYQWENRLTNTLQRI